VVLVAWALGCGKAPSGGLDGRRPLRVDRVEKTVTIPATVQVKQFDEDRHSLVTWESGRRGDRSLFPSPVSTARSLTALIRLGARAGDNLTAQTWEERNDARSTEPDKRAQGDRIKIFVTWNGRDKPLPLHEIFANHDAADMDFRLAGNGRLIQHFRSGCIACACSCPGAKVANHSYTVREHIRRLDSFRVRPGVLPSDGSDVTVIFKVTH